MLVVVSGSTVGIEAGVMGDGEPSCSITSRVVPGP